MSVESNDSTTAPLADETLPVLALMQLMYQQWRSPALYVATYLGIADALGDDALTVTELADKTGSHAPSLYRVLRALAHIGVFSELPGTRFVNNSQSQLLRSDVSGSISEVALMTCGLMHGAWTELIHTVQTGQPGFERAYGMPMWPHLNIQNPEAGAQFSAAMNQASTAVIPAIVHAADLAESPPGRIVDIGGGQGALLRALLDSNPGVDIGVLFDQPSVIEQVRTEQNLEADGRVQLVGGDFFSAVPPGADLYLMKWILHDWDDASCIQLLGVCKRAMHPDSRLLVIDLVIDPDRSDELAYAMDLEMLVSLGGKERTAAEFDALYKAAGLQLTRIIPTASMYSLVEGTPLRNGKDA